MYGHSAEMPPYQVSRFAMSLMPIGVMPLVQVGASVQSYSTRASLYASRKAT